MPFLLVLSYVLRLILASFNFLSFDFVELGIQYATNLTIARSQNAIIARLKRLMTFELRQVLLRVLA